MKLDADDLRIVLGALLLSAAVLWAAAVLGAAILLVRLIGGL